ncbi:hypothetical protein [Treponema putidum]|uniref:hypothetical protein n=1 Tax=Treponema putidum TaxID=221027 RepID=UPI003D90DD37
MNDLNFTQEFQVFKPKKEGVFPVTESDWGRLKNLIQKIIPDKKIYNTLYSLCFGIFASSIFSLITFYSVQNLATWILPTNWAISISALIIGIVILMIDFQQKNMIIISSEFIIEEMKKLEERYVKIDGI